jgi:hypothetical protein
MRHIYTKKASPHLNGKVERSHRTDQGEFYQLLEYTGDIDIGKRSYGNGRSSTIATVPTPH